MIPLQTAVPARTFAASTAVLIALHAAAFLVLHGPAGPVHWAAAGADAPRLGAIAASWVHEGLLRLAADGLCLWILGENVEDRTGHARFVLLYVLCGSAALGATMATGGGAPIGGAAASGAVAGTIGAHLALYPRSRVLFLVPLPRVWIIEASALALVALWAAAQLADSLLAPAGTAAPVGAAAALVAPFATGALLVRLLARRERMRPAWWHDGSAQNVR